MSPSHSVPPTYYERVADYYDLDARTFESRSQNNLVLQRLRQHFRAESAPFARGRILEIGNGPGLDLIYWAEQRPEAEIVGLDVSAEMQACAERNLRQRGLTNARALVGTVEDLPRLFAGVRFDFVYCYFGALNTTENLAVAARALHQALQPEGTAVLTFVNRWYALEVLYGLARLRWRKAFARLRPIWGGYANDRTLESRCLSPSDIRRAFGPQFDLVRRRGYCLLYPAWYRNPRWVRNRPRLSECLWRADGWLNRTPLWPLGEYALYILQPRPAARSPCR
jgi:ubiquinone/menaquinone biosynthesis C-methylase UbiE